MQNFAAIGPRSSEITREEKKKKTTAKQKSFRKLSFSGGLTSISSRFAVKWRRLIEIEAAVAKLKKRKSPSVDNISAEEIQAAGTVGVDILFELCREIWNTEFFLQSWKKSVTVPIHKKSDRLCRDNYRGISLLPIARKLLHPSSCIGSEYKQKNFSVKHKQDSEPERVQLINCPHLGGYPKNTLNLGSICMCAALISKRRLIAYGELDYGI